MTAAWSREQKTQIEVLFENIEEHVMKIACPVNVTAAALMMVLAKMTAEYSETKHDEKTVSEFKKLIENARLTFELKI